MTRIALIGANGQLGSDLLTVWGDSALAGRGDELVPLTHAGPDGIEITDTESVRTALSRLSPAVVINTASFIRVDDCEDVPETAMQVNAIGARNLAQVCGELGATLVHLSTDYVFDGEATEPYAEDAPASPQSAYGVSKLAGEQFIRYLLPDNHAIVRSSGLYGVAGASGKGGNFVETMLRVAGQGKPLQVVDDQTTCPTSTRDLAIAILQLIEHDGRGTFHITNSGACTWYQFAATIFELCDLQPVLSPTTTASYGLKAHRPAYSVLANDRLTQAGVAQPGPWRDALRGYLALKGHLKQ
jgi:dTDP-4-dehydrorhamnose reductase